MSRAGYTSPTTPSACSAPTRSRPRSLLATIALALAGVQVLLTLWIYRKLPLAAGLPRPVPITHRVTGFALFALTVPVAVHCLSPTACS